MNFQIGDVVTVRSDPESRGYMRQWLFEDGDINWLIGKPLTIKEIGSIYEGTQRIIMNFGELQPPRRTIRSFNFPETALELYQPIDLFQEHYL